MDGIKRNTVKMIELMDAFKDIEGWYISFGLNCHGHDIFEGTVEYELSILEPHQNFAKNTHTLCATYLDDEELRRWIAYLECKLEMIRRGL